ncbi:MAG: phage protease [Pseudomonadota bacterium]
MKPTNATPQIELPVAIGVATLSADVLAAPGEDWPRWVKVTPRGEVVTRDGRRFTFVPERLVARFNADSIEVPIDLDHEVSKSASSGRRADAVGWTKQLEARPDGTYALVDLLASGKDALAKKTHRYVSPTFDHTKEGVATWLHSFALVAAPALAMPAIAAAHPTLGQETETTIMPKEIAKALGLAEGADETACLSAITTLQAGTVAKAVHDQALTNLAAATGRVAELEAQIATRDRADHEAKVTATLDAALKAKKIVPAQRDKYASLCATPAGLAEVQALLDVTPATLQASNLDERAAETGDVPKHEDLLAKANAEIKKAQDAGLTLSLADAVVKVSGGLT